MNAAEFLKYYRNPMSLHEDTLPVLREVVDGYPWFREGWMLYLKNLKNLGDPDFDRSLHEVALRMNNRRRLKLFLESGSGDKWHETDQGKASVPGDYSPEGSDSNADFPGGRSGKRELIETFLAGGATFGNLTADPGNGSGIDLAEKAAEVSDDILTGTFAELLVSQGKYAEAIEAFNKLTLRFPGKSIYFAARIEEVKNRMNH